MTRIAWIMVGLCAATLASAQMARPPDTPPKLAGPGFEVPDYQAMKGQPPRPPAELPTDTRAAYEAAVTDEACPDATDALIEIYIADYPLQKALSKASDVEFDLWWQYTGLAVYPGVYDCFAIRQFNKAAQAYDATGRTDFRWCGQRLVLQSSELRKDPLLSVLDRQIGNMGFLTHDGPEDDPFSARAVRALLIADDRYAFVDLAPTARFALLAILRSRDSLTAAEEKAFAESSKNVSSIHIDYINDNIDFGVSVLQTVAAKYCGEK
ncbi:MAG: hypothetical protein OEL78_03825 [Hyphomicrobiales bacterium]|nr:hypothetical protein [Hyphomicrobiales bacterium]